MAFGFSKGTGGACSISSGATGTGALDGNWKEKEMNFNRMKSTMSK